MTSREQTGFLPIGQARSERRSHRPISDWAYRLLYGAIGWPWLLRSLWGGTKADKARLLARVGLREGALPHLGSWKADTAFLHRIVDAVELMRPATVVELGAGASTLVCARALALHGGGRLVSYDQHAPFVAATSDWLASHDLHANLRHAPLDARVEGWPGHWYRLDDVPPTIDLLIIDGPPWTEHPYVRGAAETLFERLSPGGMILLDDGARPGERVIARRWRKRWPGIGFELIREGTKGTLLGRRRDRKAAGSGGLEAPSQFDGLRGGEGAAKTRGSDFEKDFAQPLDNQRAEREG